MAELRQEERKNSKPSSEKSWFEINRPSLGPISSKVGGWINVRAADQFAVVVHALDREEIEKNASDRAFAVFLETSTFEIYSETPIANFECVTAPKKAGTYSLQITDEEAGQGNFIICQAEILVDPAEICVEKSEAKLDISGVQVDVGAEFRVYVMLVDDFDNLILERSDVDQVMVCTGEDRFPLCENKANTEWPWFAKVMLNSPGQHKIEVILHGAKRHIGRFQVDARIPKPAIEAHAPPNSGKAPLLVSHSSVVVGKSPPNSGKSLPHEHVGSLTIDEKELVFGAKIGEGSYGQVFRGSFRGQDVAIKRIHISTLTKATQRAFISEVEIQYRMRCDYIIPLYGVVFEPSLCLIFPFMENGSLYEVLQDNQRELSWLKRHEIAHDIARGIHYLHSSGVIHRDLKSANVLLDGHMRAKLSDFGHARLRDEVSTRTQISPEGTVRWMAPELMSTDPSFSTASDMYAYGVIVWEIVSRAFPFAGAKDTVIMEAIRKRETLKIPPSCPGYLRDMMQLCWNFEAENRPAPSVVIEHLDAHLKEVKKPKLFFAPIDQEEFVKRIYNSHPVPGKKIKHIQVVYCPHLQHGFEAKKEQLNSRYGNSYFDPRWEASSLSESEKEQRKLVCDIVSKIGQNSQEQIAINQKQFSSAPPVAKMGPKMPASAQAASVDRTSQIHYSSLRMWHATSKAVLYSVIETGYACLKSTDQGFFGSGIYTAAEADYAYRTYGREESVLILNEVIFYSAFPVVNGDEKFLVGRSSHENYDAHFIPVISQNTSNELETWYRACRPGEQAMYHELVVFDSAQCLPQYVVTLEDDESAGRSASFPQAYSAEAIRSCSAPDTKGQYISPQRMNQIIAGQCNSNGDDNGKFNQPWHIAIDSKDHIIVPDTNNNRLQVLTKEGKFLCKFGRPGNGDGEFNMPSGAAVNPKTGFIYVADYGNSRIQVFSLVVDGISPPSMKFEFKFGSLGTQLGQMNQPRDVAISQMDGRVYVVDSGNKRVQIFTERGEFAQVINSRLSSPVGIAIDARDVVYVADTGLNSIIVFEESRNASTRFGKKGEADGDFFDPRSICIDDRRGYVIVGDKKGIQVFNKENYSFVTRINTLEQVFPTSGVAVDSAGRIIASNYASHTIEQFSL